MVDVMELLRTRQGKRSDEQFANEIGLRGSTFWRYHNGKSDINMQAREKLIEYFSALGDTEMVGALLAYKAGRHLEKEELNSLGRLFLGFANGNKKEQALAPSA